MNNDAKIFAHNLKILMEHHQDTQVSPAKKAGISQKTIPNMLNPGETSSPNLANLSAIAKAYKTQAWLLLYPDAAPEIIRNSTLEHLIHLYTKAGAKDREYYRQIAELTAKFCTNNQD